MNSDEIKTLKSSLRVFFRERRKKISLDRRAEVKTRLQFEFFPLLESMPLVLSFASKNHEIDLWPINEKLSHLKRLVLPRVDGMHLRFFLVDNIEKQLEFSNAWNIREPIPSKCDEIKAKDVHLVLVPGLAFDKRGFRLGYGKGFYDRLLEILPPIMTWGIGYEEQLSEDFLPVYSHEKPLTHLHLF